MPVKIKIKAKEDLKDTIAKNLRAIRLYKKLSQRDLGQATGLDEKFISQLENKARHISTRTLQTLAIGLCVEPNLLITWGDESGSTASSFEGVPIDKKIGVGLQFAIKQLKILAARMETK